MTDELQDSINLLVLAIDEGLGVVAGRALVSSDEVADLLLDLRAQATNLQKIPDTA